MTGQEKRWTYDAADGLTEGTAWAGDGLTEGTAWAGDGLTEGTAWASLTVISKLLWSLRIEFIASDIRITFACQRCNKHIIQH